MLAKPVGEGGSKGFEGHHRVATVHFCGRGSFVGKHCDGTDTCMDGLCGAACEPCLLLFFFFFFFSKSFHPIISLTVPFPTDPVFFLLRPLHHPPRMNAAARGGGSPALPLLRKNGAHTHGNRRRHPGKSGPFYRSGHLRTIIDAFGSRRNTGVEDDDEVVCVMATKTGHGYYFHDKISDPSRLTYSDERKVLAELRRKPLPFPSSRALARR